MNYQPYNDFPPHVSRETSFEAALSMEESAPTLRAKVLTAVRESGMWGFTDEELQEHLAMPPNTQRPRRRELELKGLVVNSGMRRRTRSGRNAVVWVLG
jgi:hypothetical protein